MDILALNWSIAANNGWGTYGFEIALHLARQGRANEVLLLQKPKRMATTAARQALFRAVAVNSSRARAGLLDYTLTDHPHQLCALHALGHGGQRAFALERAVYRAAAEIGLAFIEYTDRPEGTAERFRAYDMVIGGSRWNRDLLEALGVRRARACMQGVDVEAFRPGPRSGRFGRRFVIFSGGKLEFRKGQDIVIAAFKAFRSRHPDALLVAVWGNQWPHAIGVDQLRHSPHVAAPSLALDGQIDWQGWMAAAGLTQSDIALYGRYPHDRLPDLIREADVALFPNRAEGGTNLVAMETMACGVPTILSANTGHLDILSDDGAIALRRQSPVTLPAPVGTDGWGESDVEEIVAALEQVYQDRERARAVGAAGATHMAKFAWPDRIDELLGFVRAVA
jgi:glycosyltransferase involved in cell wall biosynthesis